MRLEIERKLTVGERDPLVSIVITCFNHGTFLQDAFHSARWQTYRNVEILVVDDGSTDNSLEVANKLEHAIVLHQRNAGLPSARNAGLLKSTGAYVTFLDADDILLPNAVELGVAALITRAGYAFVCGGHRGVSLDRVALWERSPAYEGDPYKGFLRGNFIAMHGTVLYDRSILVREGGFDPGLEACEDYDVYLRLARKYPIEVYSEIVAEYRQHDYNMSRNYQKMLRSALLVLRRQKMHTGSDRSYKAAYRDGIGFWKRLYGRQMIKAAVRDLNRSGKFRSAILTLAWAGQHAPAAYIDLIASSLGYPRGPH
ncbi:MAG: glycosyltransferase [Mesorhizobium sp.]|nr:MAG: glycosyltransferase [Mesorhizobium sp.]